MSDYLSSAISLGLNLFFASTRYHRIRQAQGFKWHKYGGHPRKHPYPAMMSVVCETDFEPEPAVVAGDSTTPSVFAPIEQYKLELLTGTVRGSF
jgi:hypothetical protein